MKRSLALLLLCLFLVASVTSCTPSDKNEGGETTQAADTTSDSTTEATLTALPIIRDGEAEMPIVTSVRASSTVLSAGTTLLREVYAKTGVYLNTRYDHEKENTYEILLGDTTRPESIALKETLAEYEFAIKATEKKLVIVGYDDLALAEGVSYFVSELLNSDPAILLEEGTFRIDVGFEYHMEGGDLSGFWNTLLAGDTLRAEKTEEILTMTSPDPTNWPQGGCIKDGYYYQAFILKHTASNEKNNTVKIVKYDLETGKQVKTSTSLDLNHCNDITYNAKREQFVVCHNNPYRTKLSFLDPETLTIVGTVDIGRKIYSIDYNETRDCYVVGFSGGQTFGVLNADFALVSGPFDPTDRTEGYVTQGVTSDDRYVYFVLYKENVITVYDWSGNFVTLIELAVGDVEPESIAIVRNQIYVLCGSARKGHLFRVSSFFPVS